MREVVWRSNVANVAALVDANSAKEAEGMRILVTAPSILISPPAVFAKDRACADLVKEMVSGEATGETLQATLSFWQVPQVQRIPRHRYPHD
jgi:hypothetical protein